MPPQNTSAPQNTTEPTGQNPPAAPSTQPEPVQVAAPPLEQKPASPPPGSKMAHIKKFAIGTMIAGLIGSAVIAVVAVLVGEFSDILSMALWTLLIVALHALASLGYIGSKEKDASAEELKVFSNTVFVLLVLSFITATLGIWELIPGMVVWKLYLTYFIIVFATLHGEILYKIRGFTSLLNNIVLSNYILMAVVVLLLLPIVWQETSTLPEFYYRLLAAAAIVDATLTILAVILHKIHLEKHPELKSQIFKQVVVGVDAQGNKVTQLVAPKRRMSPLVIIVGLFLFFQVVLPIIILAFGLLSF
jgi:hypothetical protein